MDFFYQKISFTSKNITFTLFKKKKNGRAETYHRVVIYSEINLLNIRASGNKFFVRKIFYPICDLYVCKLTNL